MSLGVWVWWTSMLALHLNYESTIMAMKDGLSKLKDFLEEFGGSVEMLPEWVMYSSACFQAACRCLRF